jgi:flavin-dependent dehydrogenase
MREPHNNNFDVIIAGGGPAGASAAIHLARGGANVVLNRTEEVSARETMRRVCFSRVPVAL